MPANRIASKARVLRSASCAVAIAATGCSLAPGGEKVETAANTLITTGISDRRNFNDKEAAVLLALPCDISVGAYYRLTSTVQQEALVMLCSGRRPAEPAVSLTSGMTEP